MTRPYVYSWDHVCLLGHLCVPGRPEIVVTKPLSMKKIIMIAAAECLCSAL